MPDIDGFAVIDAPASRPAHRRDIPVVVLTAKTLTAAATAQRLHGRIEFVAAKCALDLGWLADRLTQVAAGGGATAGGGREP